MIMIINRYVGKSLAVVSENFITTEKSYVVSFII